MIKRLLGAVLGAIALTASLIAAPLTAAADGESNDIGKCLSDGQVWLLVVDEDGTAIANQCVGNPETGVAALEAANLTLAYDKTNFICSIGGSPAECPTKFNGQYWNYWTGTDGSEYAYAETGPSESKPAAGSVQAWCYNKADEKSCTPPALKIVTDSDESIVGSGTPADLAVTAPTVVTEPATPISSDASDQPSVDTAVADTAEEDAPESGFVMGWVIVGVGVIAVASGLLAWGIGKNKKTGPFGSRR